MLVLDEVTTAAEYQSTSTAVEYQSTTLRNQPVVVLSEDAVDESLPRVINLNQVILFLDDMKKMKNDK